MCLAPALQDTKPKTSLVLPKGCGLEIVLRFTDIYCNSNKLKKFLNEKILNRVVDSPCSES